MLLQLKLRLNIHANIQSILYPTEVMLEYPRA